MSIISPLLILILLKLVYCDLSPCYKCPNSLNDNSCFLLCSICNTPSFNFVFDSIDYNKYCSNYYSLPSATSYAISTNVLANISTTLYGFYFNNPQEVNSTICLNHLLSYMPRRDIILLFTDTANFIPFLMNTIRYAILVNIYNIPWDVFIEYVLPYSIVDEPRDVSYNWRQRYYQLFYDQIKQQLNGSVDILKAATLLTTLIPQAAPSGTFTMQSTTTTFISGPVITWKSETSPGMLSPSQIGAFGGSCTGTAIVLVAAARSIGIPARLAGCSQSIPNDDHHWVEFWDGNDPGPMGDYWHTREGVSKGNEEGPWDSLSTPMRNCLNNLIPKDRLNTLWASSFSSSIFLPTLWSDNSNFNQIWAWKGGINRCGAYCQTWGCGPNSDQKYTQNECNPADN